MRIVVANAAYDGSLKTAAALLDAYHTLTEWSSALTAAGASVAVVQRFHTTARIERDGVSYQFTADREPPWLSTTAAPPAFVGTIASHPADVVHINGLIFPQLVAAVRRAIGARTPIVVQHHGGEFPVRGSGLVGMWQRRGWKGGLMAASAVSFTAAEQAQPWREAGVLGDQRVLEIVEASTTLRTVNRTRARSALSVDAEPVILWVGRLTTNKDPLTVLAGLEHALPQLPDARVVMVFGDDTLLPVVEQRIAASELLQRAVVVVGRVPRDEMPNYYGAADVFVSGSHSEGSGYALIEAMASGVVPVVTAIPPFRAIAGDCGQRWPAGDADAFARALVDVCHGNLATQRAATKARFDRDLSWPALAARTIAEYQSLVGG